LIKIANELQVNPQVKFYRVAVFDSNGTKSIVVENNNKTGQGVCISDIGNVSTPNFMAKGAHFVDVKTIRLTSFIEELSLNDGDELRIKIDIEGSEYHVLLDMLDNFKLWSALKEIWVEWHDRLFISNELTSKRSYIEASFEKNGVKITPWY
jgi:FkbM family methyltransferase